MARLVKDDTVVLRIIFALYVAAQCLVNASNAAASKETVYSGANELYRTRFEISDEDEYSGWPTGWTQHRGPGYPRYVKFRLSNDAPPSGGRSLRVELDGGAAAAYSPRIALQAGVTYVLAGYVRTEKLHRDRAFLSMTFLDRDGKKMGCERSQPIQDNDVWKRFFVGPLSPPAEAQSIVIGLHVEPDKTGEDLRGAVSFGDLWLGVMPRFTLVARQGGRAVTPILRPHEPIDVHCSVSGFGDAAEAIEFRLEDQQGQLMAKHRAALAAPPTPAMTGPDSEAVPKAVAEASWSPPVEMTGFYRVRAAIVHGHEQMAAADITMVVVDPPSQNEVEGFGWTLTQGSQPLGWQKLPEVLREAGIGFVRFPFACGDKEDPATIESYLEFCDQLNRSNISVAGILVPPSAARAKEPLTGKATVMLRDRMAIEAFDQKPETWYPAIEPLMARLATQIHWWQLGNDRDPGWIGCQELGRLVGRPKHSSIASHKT